MPLWSTLKCLSSSLSFVNLLSHCWHLTILGKLPISLSCFRLCSQNVAFLLVVNPQISQKMSGAFCRASHSLVWYFNRVSDWNEAPHLLQGYRCCNACAWARGRWWKYSDTVSRVLPQISQWVSRLKAFTTWSFRWGRNVTGLSNLDLSNAQVWRLWQFLSLFFQT